MTKNNSHNGDSESLPLTPGLRAPMLPMATAEEASSVDIVTVSPISQKNELNTLMGVYIPCMLSILGAILFLRLSWAVGQAGFFGVLGIFLIAGSAVFLTALSLSAISTNGTMGGGGAYYMISRSLGPEFGGAVGIIFYFANAFGTTFYLVAFADNVTDTFLDSSGVWTKIMIASIALLMTLLAAWIGADFFSKLNALIISLIVVSILTAVLSLSFGDEFGCTQNNSPDGIFGFTGFNSTTFNDNLTPDYGFIVDDATGVEDPNERYTFFGIFAIVFPAMTGIMAGANLSGDLKDPGRSIGIGTINAIWSSMVIYISLAFLVAWTVTGEYLRENVQAMQQVACWPAGEYFIVLGIVLSTLSSALGALSGAARVLQAFCKDFTEIGESNSRFGNRLLTLLRFFSYGTPGKNEPRYAVLLTWAIAQALLLLGSLDLLASIITNCFLLTYFFTNFACFVLKISGAPNFRPRFRYFSWHTALLGAILNIVIMFLASPIFATVSIVLMLLVFGLIVYSAPQVPWGDVSQALIYHQVRKYLLRLDERKSHPKFWRPSVLLIVDDPLTSLGLIDFCNNLKKGGLYVIGDVMVGNLQTIGGACVQLQDKWNDFIPRIQVKAFSEVVLAPNFRSGCQTLMLSAGLGGMRPNTVVIPFLTDDVGGNPHPLQRQESQHNVTGDAIEALEEVARVHESIAEDARARTLGTGQPISTNHAGYRGGGREEDFVGIIRDALFLNKNLLVARDFHLLDKNLIVSQVKFKNDGTSLKKSDREAFTIDIWFTDELDAEDLTSYSGGLSLMMQLAHGLNRTDIWQECTNIRIVHLLRDKQGDEQMLRYHHDRLQQYLLESRVKADFEVLVLDEVLPGRSVSQTTNEFMRAHTTKTAVLFLNLPLPPDANREEDTEYVESLATLTDGLPPTILSLSGQNQTVIATAI